MSEIREPDGDGKEIRVTSSLAEQMHCQCDAEGEFLSNPEGDVQGTLDLALASKCPLAGTTPYSDAAPLQQPKHILQQHFILKKKKLSMKKPVKRKLKTARAQGWHGSSK